MTSMRNFLNYAALPYFLIGAPQDITERICLWLSQAAGVGIATGILCMTITGAMSVTDGHYSSLQRVSIGVTAISAVTHVLLLPLGAMLVVGRQAGRKNFLSQILYTLGKVSLYLFLPCAIITALFILIMVAAGNAPAITGQP